MISLRAYAKHRNVSAMAVSLAVKAGRLKASVTHDKHGQPKIADIDLADREWSENTEHMKNHGVPGGESEYDDATKRNKLAQARLNEIKLAQAAGEVVLAAEVRQKWADEIGAAKARLLAIPSRARQALPHLSAGDVLEIENLIREALADLAEGKR